MIKTIYFDLGNVLVFFSVPKMLGQISELTGIELPQIKKMLVDTELRELYEKGLVDTKHVYNAFLKQAPKTFSLDQFAHAFSDIFTPNQELWRLVDKLKEAKIRLVLLSNTSECHFNYIEAKYPILKEFDHHVLSYKLGIWKPDERIFQHALTQAQCTSSECFYTDDVPEFIESAKKVGLHGEIFTDVPSLSCHLAELGIKI